MAKFLPSDIDYERYERETEFRVQVRAASVFADELIAEFQHRETVASTHPTMHSTKLAGRLEFLPGEVTVWAGYSGHRKSMFTGQVALDLISDGQRTLIASMEMAPARTLARMARQASAKRFPSSHWLDAFSAWTDDRLWIFDHRGRLSPTKMLGVGRYFAEELRGQQLLIDSMMMVCASEEHLDEQKQFATDVVRFAEETGLHVHLVAHCRKPQSGDGSPPTKYDVRGSSAITDQAQNVVTIWADKAKVTALEKDANDIKALALVDAVVSVEKQRSGAWEGRAGLWFDSASLRFCNDRGSSVEPYPLQGLL